MLLVGAIAAGAVVVTGLGFPIVLLPVVPLLARPLTNGNRAWAARILRAEIPRPYLSFTGRDWRTRLVTLVRDPAYWRDFAWLALASTVGVALCLLSLLLLVGGLVALGMAILSWPYPELLSVLAPVTASLPVPAGVVLAFGGVVLLLVWRLLGPALLSADAQLARWLLAPTERSKLTARVRELAESRAQTVDTQATELRRIERDLHDGAQARLVSLGMSLGLAEELVQDDPAAARELLTEARLTSEQALAELRSLVRGIHPPVLADRGLEGAIQALVLDLPLPVRVEAELAGRLTPPVESAAYFAAAEALTNVVKHARATAVTVRARHADEFLTIVVQDDGVGGRIRHAAPDCRVSNAGWQPSAAP